MRAKDVLSKTKYVAFLLGLFSCYRGQHVVGQLGASEVHLRCAGPRAGLPGCKIYRCSVAIEARAPHTRWLMLPDYMEDELKAREGILGLEVLEKRADFPMCSSVMGEVGFKFIPVPKNQLLHLPEWELRSFEDQKRVTIWLGEDPPLSTGNTLGNVCGGLLARGKPQSPDQLRAKWSAPQGTKVELAPSGFHSLDIRPLAPW